MQHKRKIKTRKTRKIRIKEEAISAETVMHVARLSRLNLSKQEVKKFQKELNEILLAFDEIRWVKANVLPSFHPLDVKNVLRKDEAEKCLPNEVALSNAEHKEKGFFRGPRAV